MHQHGTVLEHPKPVEFEELLVGLLIDPLTCMDNEYAAFWHSGARPSQISPQHKRMCPAISLNHSYGKTISLQLWPERIVVTNRGHPAKMVPQPAPPQTHIFRHRMVPRDNIGKLLVDVSSPINVVPI